MIEQHDPIAVNSAVDELKARARLLHRSVRAGDEAAFARVARLPEFKAQKPSTEEIQRKHCLTTVSREFGFSGWPQARRVLEGVSEETDFGTLLYPKKCCGFTNQWFADYDSARETLDRDEGYLLAYRRQFFVVTRLYIETLGIDPDDEDWRALGRDWVRPTQPAARARLYAKLLAGRPREAA